MHSHSAELHDANDARDVIVGALLSSTLVNSPVTSRPAAEHLAGEIIAALHHNGLLAPTPLMRRSELSMSDVRYDNEIPAGEGDLERYIDQALDRNGITDPAARAHWRAGLISLATHMPPISPPSHPAPHATPQRPNAPTDQHGPTSC